MSKIPLREREKVRTEHAINLRLSAHIAIAFLVNGRLSDSPRTQNNYNAILSTYLDFLTFPRPGLQDQQRPLKQSILYLSFLIGAERQTDTYVRFLLTVNDTVALKEINETTKQYFDDELCLRFMQALAENGIEQAAFVSDASEKTPEDIKAEGIIKWLFQQQDFRNACYYFNELARRYLEQGRLKMVRDLFGQFNQILNPSSQEIEAYIEERSKIERLVMLLQQSKVLDIGSQNVNNRLSVDQAKTFDTKMK